MRHTPALPHPLSADELVRLVERGIVGADDHVELLGGMLVEMTPQGPGHGTAITVLGELLRGPYRGIGHVRQDQPLSCGPYDTPEPDLAVVPGELTAFAARHPRGDETILAVEVCWSPQAIDRDKALVYARAGVAVYWLVDLKTETLTVHRHPSDDGYGEVVTLAANDEVELPRVGERIPVGRIASAPR